MSASPGSWTARRRPVRAVGSAVDHGSNGPRFARFAAAMEAEPPPQAQVLPETPAETPPEMPDAAPAGSAPILVRPGIKPTAGPTVVSQAADAQQTPPMPPGPPDDGPVLDDDPVGGPADGMSATVPPRRPVIDGRLRGAIPWLGIGSWVLFCGALFVSLLGWPDQTALDRVTGLWSGHESVADPPPEATQQAGPTTAEGDLPPREQDWSSMTPGTAGTAERLGPAELAPAAGPRMVREPGGPPVPQFKPRVDGVAAKFSNAFFEIGNRLQQQGDFDAAIHMRRQGTKLAPWRAAGTS